jgi:hypothetical protein
MDLQAFRAGDLRSVTPEVAGSSPVAPAPHGTAIRRICPHRSRVDPARIRLASPFCLTVRADRAPLTIGMSGKRRPGPAGCSRTYRRPSAARCRERASGHASVSGSGASSGALRTQLCCHVAVLASGSRRVRSHVALTQDAAPSVKARKREGRAGHAREVTRRTRGSGPVSWVARYRQGEHGAAWDEIVAEGLALRAQRSGGERPRRSRRS